MNWDPLQREVMAELGLVAYRIDGAAGLSPRVLKVAAASDTGGDDGVERAMLARLARAGRVTIEQLPESIRAAGVGLRGDAAAKRALWPALRALRRHAR